MINLRNGSLRAEAVIAALDLQPHPEGGHYREIWRDPAEAGSRGVGTAIQFLLRLDEVSLWHRVDAAEFWVWQAGAPLVLSISPDGHDAYARHLGPDLGMRQSMQLLVPKGHWQTATSLGHWTLVACIVAPAFTFEGFELAPKDWRPTPRR